MTFRALVKLTNTSSAAHTYVINIDVKAAGQPTSTADAIAENLAPGATTTVEGLTMDAPSKGKCTIRDITPSTPHS
ncbi:hypothetical protein GCM10027579_10140 [Calidifontibacter terrae]